MSDIEWFPEWPVPDGLPVRQVYGILFDLAGRVLVQDDCGRFNLPGGTPERSDSGVVGTLERECLEESQVRIGAATPVGYQKVSEPDGSAYAQVRMTGVVTEFCPPAPDPCTGRVYRRLMAAPSTAAGLLGWGERGEAQLAAAAALAHAQWGITASATVSPEYME